MGSKPTKPSPELLSFHGQNIRCLVVGERGVGKSSLCCTIQSGFFYEEYDCSIEENFRKAVRCAKIKSNSNCSGNEDGTCVVEFMDAFGQEEFMAMFDHQYRQADIVLFCFSLNSLRSFQELDRHVRQMIRVKDEEYCPCVLVGCKADLSKEVSEDLIRSRQVQMKAWSYIETSSKKGLNLDMLLIEIVKACENPSPHIFLYEKTKQYQKHLQCLYDCTQSALLLIKNLLGEDCGNICIAYASFSLPDMSAVQNIQTKTKLMEADERYYKRMVSILAERSLWAQTARDRQAAQPPSERVRCVDGEGLVSVQSLDSKMRVKDLKVGNRVDTGFGNFATITKVFKEYVSDSRSLICIDNVLSTRYHPVFMANAWWHAHEVGVLCESSGFYLFNFELDLCHSIKINSVVVATLGCDVGERLRSARPDLDARFGLGWWGT